MGYSYGSGSVEFGCGGHPLLEIGDARVVAGVRAEDLGRRNQVRKGSHLHQRED